ncbi:hypothetical protein [Paenibacillus sp. MMS20-IR301]|uniref:hypothetical protein n=1 Tax=Paenibacillus sp. MMS20-IR301 TaxID=2895946 RepID=UPI0028EB82F2|nr:hypothetical protein [Paenibacillus sp. MMS20-IR301]WNS44233.1 hypothetical protein LOS79_02900 [Paenibacillus sp. MMS20-IR301]
MRTNKITELERELRFYQPLFEYVSFDVQWVMLNRRLLRILLLNVEAMYEMELPAEEIKINLDDQTIEYIQMLTNFFDNRIVTLREYFDQYYISIQPLMQTSPDFFYGYFDYVSKLLTGINAEILTNQISLLQLRYLNNYVLYFYMEIVQGINRYETVTRELEQLQQ